MYRKYKNERRKTVPPINTSKKSILRSEHTDRPEPSAEAAQQAPLKKTTSFLIEDIKKGTTEDEDAFTATVDSDADGEMLRALRLSKATQPDYNGAPKNTIKEKPEAIGITSNKDDSSSKDREDEREKKQPAIPAPDKKRLDPVIESLFKGDLSKAEDLDKRTLKIFVSSTFSDSKAERNYLMRETYPKIRKFCQSLGIDFRVVDFRWGIRDQVSNDHLTTEICLAEIDKCYKQSINAPCFVFLSFSRYGWTPLARTIEAEEFEILRQGVKDEDARAIVDQWYKEDSNSVPPVYILQAISKEIPEFTQDTDLDTKKALRQKWANIEQSMLKSLSASAKQTTRLTAEQKSKWEISVTEMEVRKGIVEREDNKNRAVCLIREIKEFAMLDSLDKSKMGLIGRFIELGGNGGFEADLKRQDNIATLRDQVETKHALTEKFLVEWGENGIQEETHGKYMEEFGQKFYDIITAGVTKAVEEQKHTSDSFTADVASHANFCHKRADNFFGRADLLDNGLKYFHHSGGSRKPLVIHGISGAGKTSLVSALAIKSREYFLQQGKDPILAVRFCGTNPASCSARELTKSITRQLKSVTDSPKRDNQFSYSAMMGETSHRGGILEQLQNASEQQPVIVFIDSLDQLDNDNNDRSQPEWIPMSLPEHAYVVVSALPDTDDCYTALRQKDIPDENYLEVTEIVAEDVEDILKGWLQRQKRTLTETQTLEILRVVTDTSKEVTTVLRLKLVLDIATKLKSYDKLDDIPNTVRGLINKYLSELELTHGEALVHHLFGVLGVTKHGLGEEGLLDVLCGDEEVLDSVLQYHQPPIRRIPQVVMARLRNDLGDYIVERGAYSQSVWAWYHRQFKEAAEDRYLSNPDMKRKYHQAVADYYSDRLRQKYPDRGIAEQPYYYQADGKTEDDSSGSFNELKLVELPEATLYGENPAEMENVLCNLEFIAAKCYADMGRELIQDFLLMGNSFDNPRIKAYKRFLTADMHILEINPEMTLQRARNQPFISAVSQEAEKLSTATPWWPDKDIMILHWTKERGFNPCYLTHQTFQREVNCLAVVASPPGYIPAYSYTLGSSPEGALYVWNNKTGKQAAKFKMEMGSGIATFAISEETEHNKTIYIMSRDDRIKVVEINFTGDIKIIQKFTSKGTGNRFRVPSGHLALLKDKKSIIAGYSYQGDGNLTAQQMGDGDIKGNTGTLIAWENTGNDITQKLSMTADKLEHEHEGVSAMALSPDESLVAVSFSAASDLLLFSHVKTKSLFSILTTDGLKEVFRSPMDGYCVHHMETRKGEKGVWEIITTTSYNIINWGVYVKGTEVVSINPLWTHKFDNGCASAMLGFSGMISGLAKQIKLWNIPDYITGVPEEWERPYVTTTYADESHLVEFETLDGHATPVCVIAFKDNIIASGSTEGIVKIWDYSDVTDIIQPVNTHSFTPHALCTDPGGSITITGTNKGKRIPAELKSWNPLTAEPYATLDASSRVTSIAIQPPITKNEPETPGELGKDKEYLRNCRYVAVREDNGNFLTLIPLEQFEKNDAVSDKSEWIVVVLDGEGASIVQHLPSMVAGVDSLSFSACGRYLAATSTVLTHAVFVIDLTSQVTITPKKILYSQILEATTRELMEKKIDEDCDGDADDTTGGGNGRRKVNPDKETRVMCDSFKRLEGHKGAVQGARFSPDGSRLLSWCSGYTNTFLYDSFPTGKSEILLWDTTTWSILARVAPDYHNNTAQRIGYEMGCGFTSACFVPNQDYIASVGIGGYLSFHQLPDLNQTCTTKAHTGYIPTLKTSESGQYIVTVSHDMTLKVWGLMINPEPPVASISVGGAVMGLGVFTAPSGNLIINTGDTRARLEVFEVVTEGKDPPKTSRKKYKNQFDAMMNDELALPDCAMQ